MKKRIGVFAVLLIGLVLLAAACGARQTGSPEPTEPPEEILLSIEELAAYDGKDGRPAYVAVDGIIYDMTNSPRWRDGEHNGFSAGQDLTETIKTKSPHGLSTLSRVPVVGRIVEK